MIILMIIFQCMTEDSHLSMRGVISGLRYPVMPQARSLLLFTVFGLYCLSHIVDISSLQRCVIVLSFLYA
jgi:hypothetical protein